MRRYDAARAEPHRGELAEAQAERPTPRGTSLQSDLLVPLGQSLVTGALVGAVVMTIAAGAGADVDLVALGAGVTVGISALAWLVLLGQTRKLLWTVERWAGRDLDGDGTTGKPKERVVIVNAAHGQAEAARTAQQERRSEFARFVAALPARGTAARTWEKELGRDVYQEYRDALIRLGWARWNSTKKDGRPNERRGWTLTKDAGEILERIG